MATPTSNSSPKPTDFQQIQIKNLDVGFFNKKKVTATLLNVDGKEYKVTIELSSSARFENGEISKDLKDNIHELSKEMAALAVVYKVGAKERGTSSLTLDLNEKKLIKKRTSDSIKYSESKKNSTVSSKNVETSINNKFTKSSVVETKQALEYLKSPHPLNIDYSKIQIIRNDGLFRKIKNSFVDKKPAEIQRITIEDKPLEKSFVSKLIDFSLRSKNAMREIYNEEFNKSKVNSFNQSHPSVDENDEEEKDSQKSNHLSDLD